MQVLGISHLSRELKNADEFLACGREGVPLEMQAEATRRVARIQPTDSSTNAGTPRQRYTARTDLFYAGNLFFVF